MELWQLALVFLGGLSGLFYFGAVVWGIFDVLRDRRLDQTARILWLIVMFVLPLIGIIAWLFAKPGLAAHGGSRRLSKAP